ncbi:thiamine transport system permease protein [Rubrimonas cliftonensis]|uniref:Thiamine transport system permease protein n=1 Tax=Rubrimonas cliftonensis TaxID=89524 RepID=A0A1H4C139_9RHOB|nr:thiamine/thiamine pyrophosphate ABC transporter permease ThiP [Rubrimonas cliftonensis]SEA54059.1 thiamine transport system permease protein [Rubrimonas cliftonensis]
MTQAALSAALSVAFALPVARALSRRRFPGRAAMVGLMGAPFLLPVVVAILGVTAVWGRAGWVSDGLAALGLPRLDIYGMPGVLLAHVFFNLPLAARLLLQAYAEIPAERWRAAAQLGLEGRALWRAVEWPALRGAAPGALAAIFAVCATSFAVALTLGGGPRATTLELAIYEAAAYSFDLSRAALLALLQLAVCAGGALAALALAGPLAAAPGLSREAVRWDGGGRGARALDAAALTLAALFLGAPLAAVALKGLAGLGAVAPATWASIGEAAARSLVVAVASAAMALALALPLSAFAAALSGARGRLAEAAGLAPLAVSPFVLGVALFVALRPIADPAALALPLTALVNAVMAAPYAVRMLTPPLRAALADHGRLADSLGLGGRTRARALYLARLRGPLGFSAGVAAALSAGDLGVIALFSAPEAPTLPLLMHLLATSRQLDAAAGAALLLLGLSFGLFVVFDRLGRA